MAERPRPPASPALTRRRAEELAGTFALLSGARRFLFLLLLARAGELSSGDIAREVGTLPAALSLELSRLRAAGVVEGRRDGRRVLYRIIDPRVRALVERLGPGAQ
jgi:DNA-binding transcriptional ArsR family regulator